ncbi:MAG: hypothetical protein ACP5J8_02570 [Minisyncoccia bacterium]
MFKARKRDLSWRINYIFISSKLKTQLKRAFILKEVMVSGHCHVGIEVEE